MSGLLRSEITYREDVPLHVQVREMIRQSALSGKLVDAEGRLPTEQRLVEQFGVSRMTIRNALAPLVEEGLFARSRGRGTFLRSNQSEMWMGHLMGFQELVKEAGFEPGARVLHSGMIRADDAVQKALGERAAWELRRVRFADDLPTAIEHAFYPPDIGLELEGRDLVSIKMYRVFEEELGLSIKHGNQTIGARISSAEEQELLGLEEPTALISMTRLTIATDDRPIECLTSVYRPDIFQFSINLTRRVY